MKNLKLLVVALVAMFGFSSCDNKTEYIYDDHSADLVGTWTCLADGYAEALIINADGTAVSYGVENGEYWENVNGTVTVKENNITMIFEDNDNWTGHFDVIPGMAFSLFEENGERYIYQYCANDLADELVGMWICTDSKIDAENDMMIETFYENGRTVLTGILPMKDNPEFVLNDETDYKVVGDLMFLAVPADKVGGEKPMYIAERLIYSPKTTALGDVMTFTNYSGSELLSESWLRVKQNLNLAGKNYDYVKTYMTDVRGKDMDIQFFYTTLNFAKMDNSVFDKFLQKTLFSIEFPNANTIKYSFLEAQLTTLNAPIEVADNKITIKMSANNAAYRDIEIYAFQDTDDSQFHMYMHTKSVENFLGNMMATTMVEKGELDLNNETAVNAVYDNIDEAIESINISIVMKAAK